jgi:Family of unknown function (DUF5329)
MRLVRWSLMFLAAMALAAPYARAAGTTDSPSVEARRIERLIDAVEKSTDHRFIRNGVDYDAGTAARFLRAKWGYARDRIRTAEDFVREIGTRSSTTGSRYRVRCPDGREEDGAAFLVRQLAAPPAD